MKNTNHWFGFEVQSSHIIERSSNTQNNVLISSYFDLVMNFVFAIGSCVQYKGLLESQEANFLNFHACKFIAYSSIRMPWTLPFVDTLLAKNSTCMTCRQSLPMAIHFFVKIVTFKLQCSHKLKSDLHKRTHIFTKSQNSKSICESTFSFNPIFKNVTVATKFNYAIEMWASRGYVSQQSTISMNFVKRWASGHPFVWQVAPGVASLSIWNKPGTGDLGHFPFSQNFG